MASEKHSRSDVGHRFHHLVQLDRVGIWEWDLVTDSVYYSPAWKKLRGCDAAGVPKTFEQASQWVHPDDIGKRKQLYAKLRSGDQEQIEIECRVKRGDGSWGWIAERTHSICNDAGKPIRLVGCEVDVSESDRQQELEQLEGFDRSLVPCADSLPIAIARFEGEQCVYVNDYWSQLTGRPRESAIGDGWLNALHPDDRGQSAEFMKSNGRGIPGETVVVSGIDGRHLNPDGSINWFVAKAQLTYGMDGVLGSSSIIVQETTARMNLERQKERLIDILEATTDFIGIATLDGKTQWLNKRLASLRPDLKPEANADCLLAYPKWSRKLMAEVAIPAAIEQGSWSGKMAILDLEGNEIPVSQVVLAHKSPDGSVEAISTIMRDISEQEKIEQALRLGQRNYASLARTAPVGIFRMSDPMNCIYVNEHWGKQTERPLDAALGQGWMDSVNPDDLKVVREQMEALAADSKQIAFESIEVRLVLPSGDMRWVQCHIAKELDDDGNVTGYVGTVSDIGRMKRAEEERRKLNQRLHNVLECSSIGIWEWHCADQRLVWDEKMIEIYGVDAKDFRGTFSDWSNRIHPDDFNRVVAEGERFVEGERSPEGDLKLPQEFRIVRPSGQERYVYASVHSEFDEHGQLVRATGVNVDITDRREVEFALRASEKKLQHIADHLPGIVYRYFLDGDGNHGFQYLSSQAHELFGYESKELLADGNLLWQWINPRDAERLVSQMHKSAEDLSRHQEEFRVTIPGRGTRWFQANSRPKKSPSGGFVWDGVFLEITDQKTAEIELQETKLQMERITESVPGMIYQYLQQADGAHAVSFISPQCRELFELTPEEVMGDVELFFDTMHPDDTEQVRVAYAKSARTLEPVKVEYRILLSGERVRWLQSIGQPFRSENGDTIWNGMVLDITDRKQVELANDDLAKATKTKDEFIATMSHELRTPLTAILAMTEGLQQGMFGATTAKQMESLKIVEQSSEHLLDLINEVLDLAKIGSGQMELELSHINVSKLCESCLNFVTQQAEQKQIELSLSVPSNLRELEADEKRIRQILINLLGNAVKFTPEGGQVKLEIETPASDALRILISDTGIGIEADQLDLMFEPFVQVDSSLTRQCGGTGLGLSLVRQFVELHRGKVSVVSKPGEGSCFTIDLPFPKVRSKQGDTDRDNKSSDREQPSVSGISQSVSQNDSPTPSRSEGEAQPLILLAEDNSEVALAIVPILEFSQFRVLRATNGKAAIEMAREHSPDLILMDVQMPEMDGLKATREIRKFFDRTQLPIITVSGFARPEDSQRCIAAGANLFMSKPTRMKELVSNINRLLSEKKKR